MRVGEGEVSGGRGCWIWQTNSNCPVPDQLGDLGCLARAGGYVIYDVIFANDRVSVRNFYAAFAVGL